MGGYATSNTNQAVAIIRVNHETTDYNYVYYYLSQKSVQQYVRNLNAQSAQPNVNLQQIGDIELSIPIDKENQLLVSTILSSYDDKIENNIKYIDTLKCYITALYQSWFADFNYPDATGEMIDGIPIGWTKSSVFDNVTEVREKNRDDLDYPVLSVVKEGEFKLSDDVFTKQVYSKNLNNYKIVRRNQVGYNPARANIGSIAMLTDFDIGLVSPVYVVFEIKDTITPTFFYYYMYQPMFAEGIKHHAIGTTRQNFPFEAFKMFPMIIPPMELQKRFEEIAKPIEQKIANLKEENAVLAEIRDTLLPKLMSGELPVEVGEA
ncbi:MAG TPA: restriction endonuclease subunit S [Clostridia bacterium]|nr:restriction endonuclease subunit S [Clostridia bacterium]